MEISHPVLSGDGPVFAPARPVCLHCGRSYANADSNAFLVGGAIQIDPATGDSVSPVNNLRAYLEVGVHPMRSYAGSPPGFRIVNDLVGGEFALNYCSLKCLKSWWVALIDQLASLEESGLTSTE